MTDLLQVLTLMAIPIVYFATIRAIILRQNRIAERNSRPHLPVTGMSSPR